MNLKQINEFRARLGLAPVEARKDSREAQKRQARNQAARAAANSRNNRKGK